LGCQTKCNKRIGHPGGRHLYTENGLIEISSMLALEEDEKDAFSEIAKERRREDSQI
jgi:hypothetical protein